MLTRMLTTALDVLDGMDQASTRTAAELELSTRRGHHRTIFA